MRRTLAGMLLIAGLGPGLGGCVERTMTVQTNPPGALVTMNDQEVGRAPFTRSFLWYGYYDVQVRREGYQTINTTTPVIAPWWQWIPFDFVAEVLPLRLEDPHTISYTLVPKTREQVDPGAIMERGQMLQERLESSRNPNPQTKATTRPTKAK